MNILPDFGIKKNIGIAVAAGTLFFVSPSIKAQNILQADSIQDTFEHVDTITPKGTTEKTLLLGAPNPEITIKGELKTAVFVVDLSKNILYHYNELGEATEAYLVASGKKKYPTRTGVRVVSHVERYPYKYAPESSKRHKNPRAYGPRIIILDKLDPESGERSSTGQFIHGNNNFNSLGEYVSLGCIRMDNEVIKRLAKQVKSGDIVIIKKDE